MKFITVAFFVTILALSSQSTWADMPDYRTDIKEHRFVPAVIKIPANTKIVLTVSNNDDSREEFESDVLQLEKIINPGSSKKIYIGPLKPGEYPFFGDYHPDTAHGVIKVE